MIKSGLYTGRTTIRTCHPRVIGNSLNSYELRLTEIKVNRQ